MLGRVIVLGLSMVAVASAFFVVSADPFSLNFSVGYGHSYVTTTYPYSNSVLAIQYSSKVLEEGLGSDLQITPMHIMGNTTEYLGTQHFANPNGATYTWGIAPGRYAFSLYNGYSSVWYGSGLMYSHN